MGNGLPRGLRQSRTIYEPPEEQLCVEQHPQLPPLPRSQVLFRKRFKEAVVHALDGPSKSRTAVCLDVGSLPAALPARTNVCPVFYQERTG